MYQGEQLVEKNRKRGIAISTATHIVLILLLLLPLLSYQTPPPGQPGILVALGSPDEGQGDDEPMPQGEDPTAPQEEVTEEQVQPEVAEPEPEPEPVPQKAKPTPAPEKKVLTDDNSKEIALKKEKEEARKKAEAEKQAKAEEERRRQAAIDAQKRAEAEARAKAEADAKAKADAKSKFGSMFGKDGKGTGRGDTGKPGNQGDPNGDPNSDNLKGISTGTGDIGGGLSGRNVVRRPSIKAPANKSGIVVVNVCVDADGNVTSAKYTQKGSTTSDATLIDIAEDSARKYSFGKDVTDKQCGTISIRFKPQ